MTYRSAEFDSDRWCWTFARQGLTRILHEEGYVRTLSRPFLSIIMGTLALSHCAFRRCDVITRGRWLDGGGKVRLGGWWLGYPLQLRPRWWWRTSWCTVFGSCYCVKPGGGEGLLRVNMAFDLTLLAPPFYDMPTVVQNILVQEIYHSFLAHDSRSSWQISNN